MAAPGFCCSINRAISGRSTVRARRTREARIHATIPKAAPTTRNAAAGYTNAGRSLEGLAGGAASHRSNRRVASSAAISRAVGYRSSGRFSSERCTILSSSDGTSRRTAASGAGGSRRIEASVRSCESPWNGRRPASIS
jgi:hypothetical protein